MAILRSKRPERNFTTLPNALINDSRLSWEARGLLIFILSKPDHWEVRTSHLIKQTEGSRKQSKRDSVRAMLNELEQTGYVRKSIRRQADGGRFEGYDYIVYESPEAVQKSDDSGCLPETDLPETDLPETAQPKTANPPLVNTEVLERTEGLERTDNSIVAAGHKALAAAPVDHAQKANIPADMPGPKDTNVKTFKAWANYAIAFKHRYKAWPIWNARVAGQMSNLVDRVGKDLAPKVAAWYVKTNTQYYVNKGHSVGIMIADCETLAVQCQNGRQVTQQAARQADATQSNLDIADEVAARIMARKGSVEK